VDDGAQPLAATPEQDHASVSVALRHVDRRAVGVDIEAARG